MGLNILENRRRMIMAAQPHLETASGQSVVITNGFPAPLASCVVTFGPAQAGSGDPSPSNIRELSGRTELSVFVSPISSGGTEYPVSWSDYGTVYGGTIDLVCGLLIKTLNTFVGTDVADVKLDRYDSTTVIGKLTVDSLSDSASNDIISNRFSTNIASGNAGRMVAFKNNNLLYIVMPRSDFAGVPTAADIQQWLVDHPTIFVYPLADPVAYQLPASAVRTIRGENHIWSDAGSVSAAYYTI